MIELICFNVALYFLKKDKAMPWRVFPWFILTVALLDGTGWALDYIFKVSNQWLYNITLVIFVLFITWLFYHIYRSLFNSGPVLTALLAAFFITFTIESFDKALARFNNVTFMITGAIFVIASCAYYYLLLKSDKIVMLLKHPEFWLVTGIFLFYFGNTTPVIFFKEIMGYEVVHGVPLWELIFPVLNLILYGCWAYAFRCRYRQTISSF